MKTSLTTGVLAAAIIFSFSSCSSCTSKNKGEQAKADSPKTAIDTTQKIIDTTKKQGLNL